MFILTENATFPVIIRGTGTAIRFDGNEVFVCTQHQLNGIDFEKVGMMTEDGGKVVTSGAPGRAHFIASLASSSGSYPSG